jgi:DNA-binding transcriptional ArsR family regulator
VRSEDLAEQVRQLAERVSRLERAGRRSPRTAALDQEILDRLGVESGPDTVRYSGVGQWGGDTLAWQREHEWGEVLERVGDGAARLFGALGNPVRLRIVSVLLAGPAATAELTERLDQPSTGQLFHHLKELLTAGLVHQPVRGTYAIRRQDVIPLLAVLSASLDLAASGGALEPA